MNSISPLENAPSTHIRVLLVDDHPLVREGICASLAPHRAIEIVGQTDNGEDAVRQAKHLLPDVVLIDINLPKLDGIKATQCIRKSCPKTKILILTVHDSAAYAQNSLEAGAHGYLLKDSSPLELIEAIEIVQRNQPYISPRISKKLTITVRQSLPARALQLSRREKEIVRLIARGMVNKQIADELDISPSTVNTYRQRIMDKINVRNAVGITRYAVEQGLLPNDPPESP